MLSRSDKIRVKHRRGPRSSVCYSDLVVFTQTMMFSRKPNQTNQIVSKCFMSFNRKMIIRPTGFKLIPESTLRPFNCSEVEV